MPLKKPASCEACPLYGNGEGWVPDLETPDAEVLIIGLFPSQYEATTGEPGVGMTVEEYATQFEKYAGQVLFSRANVVRCRGTRGVKLPTGKKLREGALFCRQYDRWSPAIKLVVYCGEDVAKHLRPDIKSPLHWRGYTLPADRTKEEDERVDEN